MEISREKAQLKKKKKVKEQVQHHETEQVNLDSEYPQNQPTLPPEKDLLQSEEKNIELNAHLQEDNEISQGEPSSSNCVKTTDHYENPDLKNNETLTKSKNNTGLAKVEKLETEQINFDILMNKSQDLMKQIKLQDIKETAKTERTVISTEIVKNTIKPYTEAQLNALYYNGELNTLEAFVDQYVDAELKGQATKRHPLYELLTNYLRVREKITGNNLELDQIRKEYLQQQQELWSIKQATVDGRGECQDGTIVSTSHSYSKSIFHRSIFQSVVRMLSNVQKLVYENHTLYTYLADDLKMQIELYLQRVIVNCLNVTQLNKDAPVALTLEAEPPHLKPYLGELRMCISILFAFQRKLIQEVQFIKETRGWLSQLIALLLRVANYNDHLFIVNHILRCPAGVGSWASSFVQTPLAFGLTESPFANFQINHVLTILAAILSPIKAREQFLEDIAQNKDTAVEALWVMVDSDGEEDQELSGTSLKENDLVALLNQLPLDMMFKNVLLVYQKDYQDVYNPHAITEHHMLRYLAFSTVLLRVIHRGLQIYDQPKYNQFSKRLSRFIRHVAQYATDQWEQFLKVQNLDDKAMLERLQVEYDAFFLRTIYYLYSSQKLGAWQFLAVVPYNMVTLKTLWKIFYFLHSSDNQAEEILNPLDGGDYIKKFWEPESRRQFEEKLNVLEDAEVYYLLNTFANMALARSQQDMEFIKSATMDLLKIGFISEATKETCSKSSKILLTHLTSNHPHLLSDILREVSGNLEAIDSLALYLYEELPLSVWKLDDNDLEIIARLLLHAPSTSVHTKLARMILSRLNWDIIPYEIHCDVACLVVTAAVKDPALDHWGWQIIVRLKLHFSDKACDQISKVQEVEKYDALMAGLRVENPLVIFVACLMTSWGHMVPVICTKGFDKMLYLQSQGKQEAVLFLLYQIVPLFVNSQECLINCEMFQRVLVNLLNADRGYISMAKSLVYQQNTVLQQFGNMIETQISNFAYYGFSSPKCMMRLWTNSLVSIPNWNKDMGIMYLLNIIIKTVFIHIDASEAICIILKEQLQCSTQQDSAGTISSIFKWVSSSPNSNGTLISNSLSSYTWLAYLMISIEYEEREKQTGLWYEILIQLEAQKGKINVDQAIKKACSTLKVPVFTSASLSIYRWAQQALDTPVDHPLLPLLWQNFFSLYLARIPAASTAERSCVGERFFDGLVNFSFQKKIKRRLQETVEYFQNKIDCNGTSEIEMARKPFYKSCHKVFTAFCLWLEEPRLQENNLLVKDLPPQYEPRLLTYIIQGSNTPWYEFLDREKLKSEQEVCVRAWRVANFREKTNVNQPLLQAGCRNESNDPVERILRRLTSYDSPKPPPEIKVFAPLIPQIEFAGKEDMFKSLDPCFRILQQCAHNHFLKVSEQKGLDCAYQELVPQLYRSVLNKVKKTVPCRGKNQTVHCSGAAVIVLEMQEARVNERIDHQIQTNRNAYESLLATVLQSNSRNFCSASVTLQQTIKSLQQQLKCNPATAELGVELFYYILSLLTEDITSCPPTKTLFSNCLEKLGQSHIGPFELEKPRLLNKILSEPNLSEYLAPHFSPSNVSTANLLLMYGTISKEIGKKYDVSFALLSKFEIEQWLNQKQPKIVQRSQFIQTVIKSLSTFSLDPPIEALILHNLYRKHLLTVFEFQFPEHYGEVLMQLLNASTGNPEPNLIALSVWLDVLNSLARPATLSLKAPLRDQLRMYAQNQRVLQHQELLQTAELLSRHFTQQRLQYGLYGIYPNCRSYVDIYVLFLGLIGHGIIVSMLNTHQGLLGDKMCEKIWPFIRDMFAPWLVPYSMQQLKDNMATWIQQLADDRTVLLPWIPPDGSFAQKMLDCFRECITFIIHTLPASTCILSYVWQWYVNCYAHTSVKDHILIPVHQTFSTFPWQNFWPSVVDVELMLRVIDQHLLECHSFLGHIFVSIPWASWLGNFTAAPAQLKNRMYQCFLNLLVKLCNEPNVRKNYSQQAKSILMQAESWDWTILESAYYQHVTDWFVMSCDSLVIFRSDPLDIDYRVLHFLKTVSGYDKQLVNSTNEGSYKRLIYVKTYIKLLSVYINRHRNTVSQKEKDIYLVISRQLNDLENVVDNEEEMINLLKEILSILNNSSVSGFAFNAFYKWIETKPGNGIIIRSLLKTLAVTVKDSDLLAELLEASISSYFMNMGTDNFQPSWREVGETLNVNSSKQTELEQSILNKSCILSLNAIFVQRVCKCNDPGPLLNLCLNWLVNVKISSSVEPKLPLIWCGFLNLVYQHAETDERYCAAILRKFSEILIQTSDDKGGSSWGRGLLSAIGLAKQGKISVQFKFICRALAGYVLAQLPELKQEAQLVRKVPNAPAKVGQPGGNTECVKVLLTLDFGHTQGIIKECADLALKQIQDANNSLHNVRKFLMVLVQQFYTQAYLKDLG